MIFDILKFIASLIGVCVVFGLTVFVHELGHFLAARYKGLYVERFAIGFGPKIFGFKRNGVEYVICWIPFGGYVSLPQMAPMEMVEGKNEIQVQDLPSISPWAKIVTAFWGPAFSFFLALSCATLLFFIGKNENTTLKTTTVGYVDPGSPADQAGIIPGDRILTINGAKVTHWNKNGDGGILQAIILSSGEVITLEVEHEGSVKTYHLTPVPNPELEGLHGIGLENPENRFMPLVIESIIADDAPAAEAGLKPGDRVTRVNGKEVYSMAGIAQMIQNSGGEEISIRCIRKGKEHEVSVTPRLELTTGKMMIGVKWKSNFTALAHVSPFTQINDSVVTMARTLQALLNPESSVGVKHMSGPIGIFDVLRKLLLKDFRDLIAFCVFFNVNLAILNLLPMPILDGGHILFATIEWVARRPLHVKVLYVLQTSFFIILIAFMLFVSFHDVERISKSHKANKEIEQMAEEKGKPHFAPEQEPAK